MNPKMIAWIKNAIIIDLDVKILEGNVNNFLEIVTAFTTLIKQTQNVYACVTGDENILKKIHRFDHFSLNSQSIYQLIESDLVKSSQIVAIHSSIQNLVPLREKLAKDIHLLFVPTEEVFDIPPLTDQDKECTWIYDKRLLRFCANIYWWTIQANLLQEVPYFEHISTEGFAHEIEMMRQLIMLLDKHSQYQKIEEILAYLSKKYPNHDKVINIYGVYYHNRARNDTGGLPLRGSFVHLAEEKYRQAVALNPLDASNNLCLAFFYAQAYGKKRMKAFIRSLPPEIVDQVVMKLKI